MISDFTVSRCTEESIDELMEFIARMHSAGITFVSLDTNNFRSKYRPYREEGRDFNLFIIRGQRGEIAGCSGYMPFESLFNGKGWSGIIGCDAIIDPEYRKQFPGLLLLLARCYEKFIFKDKFLPLGFPYNNEVQQSFMDKFCEEFTEVCEFVRPLASKKLPDLKSSLLQVRRIDYFAKDINAFFERISAQHHFIMNGDSDFLNWKYPRNPYAKYVMAEARKGGRIVGYVVAELRQRNIYIDDITVDLKFPQAILLLIYKALGYFNRDRAVNVSCYLSHKSYQDILLRAGFSPRHKQSCLFFKVPLLFAKIGWQDLLSSDRNLYHFNGLARYMY